MTQQSGASTLAKDIILLPWDSDSPDQVQRLIKQRVDCGWNAEKVESSWASLQKSGTKCLYWVGFSADRIEKSDELQNLLAKFMKDQTFLQDTATSIRNVARKPSGKDFCAIGHVSLDTENTTIGYLNLDPIPESYWITSFFIDYSLQSLGFGRSVMDTVEGMATDPPLSAKTLVLDTLHRDDQVMIAVKYHGQEPKISNQAWYERRGYRLFFTAQNHYRNPDKNGQVIDMRTVFMRRDLE
ncbi:hypothetical protein K461DRAFT_311689 [Myriangium duriaei CBS 260.36]|uniref:N-acetyltransferase domain-containing protein n=1 Tax=Myriangium duriaei CBS 260.36 TaxID=1168546 RepID=A0A9P4J4T7_9PEZI|nr:hypothetical protein K461DRAFT_311689 [Myriangium duriaei CBS 260.36]